MTKDDKVDPKTTVNGSMQNERIRKGVENVVEAVRLNTVGMSPEEIIQLAGNVLTFVIVGEGFNWGHKNKKTYDDVAGMLSYVCDNVKREVVKGFELSVTRHLEELEVERTHKGVQEQVRRNQKKH